MNNNPTQIYAAKAILDFSRVQRIMLLLAGKSQWWKVTENRGWNAVKSHFSNHVTNLEQILKSVIFRIWDLSNLFLLFSVVTEESLKQIQSLAYSIAISSIISRI